MADVESTVGFRIEDFAVFFGKQIIYGRSSANFGNLVVIINIANGLLFKTPSLTKQPV